MAIYLFFHTFSMSSLDPTLKKCPIYVILHMMHTCGMYKVELSTTAADDLLECRTVFQIATSSYDQPLRF